MSSVSGSLAPSFNAQSSYASDLQTALNRAIQIASLPVQLMQSDVSTMQAQQQALSGLQSVFGSVQSSLTSINSAVTGTLSANVNDPSVASATATSAALAGTYTLQVIQVGTSTSTLSSAGLTTVTDPGSGNISSASSFTLTVNGTAFTISPSGNTLNDLATAINGAGAGVQATIVNVGGTTNPDYRLAVTSSNVGNTSIQLNDGTNNLLDTLTTGIDAEYSVDGSAQVNSTSNQITIAPGLTANLLDASTSPVTITVGADYSALSSALANFASAYNSATSSLDQQIGQNAGPLAGQSLIYTLDNALNGLVNYSGGTGAVSSLASLGLTLDSNGQMSFDSTVFNTQNISAIQQFLGGTTTGGFLQAASTSMTAVEDPTTGQIQSEFNSLQTEVTNENTLISNEEVRVNDLTTNMTAELSQADATIANLEAQKTYYTELFQAQYPSSSSS